MGNAIESLKTITMHAIPPLALSGLAYILRLQVSEARDSFFQAKVTRGYPMVILHQCAFEDMYCFQLGGNLHQFTYDLAGLGCVFLMGQNISKKELGQRLSSVNGKVYFNVSDVVISCTITCYKRTDNFHFDPFSFL